jgi:hypothetical protein
VTMVAAELVMTRRLQPIKQRRGDRLTRGGAGRVQCGIGIRKGSRPVRQAAPSNPATWSLEIGEMDRRSHPQAAGFCPSCGGRRMAENVGGVSHLSRPPISLPSPAPRPLGVYLETQNTEMALKEAPPERFVLVTMAQFADNYISMRQGSLGMLALGNWKRNMAPPSILEFIITLIMRESIAFVSPSLRGSEHLGTKGCLSDFVLPQIS